jgi:hypothetical protein
MGNKKDELHADFETVETVPVKKAISEEKKRLSCEILYSMGKSFRPLIIWGEYFCRNSFNGFEINQKMHLPQHFLYPS